MSDRLAIIAGRGDLPGALARACPDALLVSFSNVDGVSVPQAMRHLETRFEHLGSLFARLRGEGVGEVVFAGAMERPCLAPGALDAPTRALIGDLEAAMAGRDDALMRWVVALFEDEGFVVRGGHQVAPDLLAPAGMALGVAMDEAAAADGEEGARILAALAPLDLGQAVVVEAGQCLGIETLQGTDALLDFVAATPTRLRRGRGVLVKLPKAGQELRLDMPVIGPDTLEGLARAGLAGMVVQVGGVLVLERARLAEQAQRLGLFVVAR